MQANIRNSPDHILITHVSVTFLDLSMRIWARFSQVEHPAHVTLQIPHAVPPLRTSRYIKHCIPYWDEIFIKSE